MELTNENYFQDKTHLNNSTLKIYSECSSKALAISKGEYQQEFSSTALLVGSYVDSAIEGTLEQFKNENLEIYKYKNPEKGLKSEFVEADKMIEKINQDKFAKILLTGEKQRIFTGEIEGIKVKCKVDNINFNKKFFTDLKTCRDIFETQWNPETKERESFIQFRGYLLQLAFYREIIRQNTGEEFIACIVAYDKTDNLRGLTIQFTKEEIDNAYIEVLELIRQHKEALEGNVHRCEKCDYCNSTRKTSLNFSSFNDFLMFI